MCLSANKKQTVQKQPVIIRAHCAREWFHAPDNVGRLAITSCNTLLLYPYRVYMECPRN